MTSPPPSPNPLADPTVTDDLVPVAVRAVGAEFATAIALMGLVTWTSLLARGSAPPTRIEDLDPQAANLNILLYGGVVAILLAGAVGWRLMQPVRNTWRRFGLVAVGALGGLVLGMAFTVPVHMLGGAVALLVLAALAGALAVRLAIAARRAAP